MNNSPSAKVEVGENNNTAYMARRTITIILLPLIRFLAMANAFFGLLFYEEKNGHMNAPAKYGFREFLLPVREAELEVMILPEIVQYLPPKSEDPGKKMGHARESLEEELPEHNLFHIASARLGNMKKKRKLVWTPFGEFTISFLDIPFGYAARA